MSPRVSILLAAVCVAVSAFGQTPAPVSRPPALAPSLEWLAQQDKAGVPSPGLGAKETVSAPAQPAPLPEPAKITKKLVSGTGPLSFQWKGVPLTNAIRVLARHLGKPVNVGVAKNITVSGDYKELKAEDILRDIADNNGLLLTETPSGYTVRDDGRPDALPVARVIFK